MKRTTYPVFLICLVLLVSGSLSSFAQFRILLHHAHANLGYSEPMFLQHMDFLHQNGYNTVTLDQFWDWKVNDEPMPLRPIVLTFDDNYILTYDSMYPIMKERGQVGTNFVITDSVGRPGWSCDWSQILEMEREGVILAESHTVSHPYLAQISVANARRQVTDAKTHLENWLRREVRFIAYPYGNYNSTVIHLCEEAGYTGGLKAAHGINYRNTPPFELERISADGLSLEQFKQAIGYYELPPDPPGEGWTIDNEDVNFLLVPTQWDLTTTSPNYYGNNYRIRASGDGTVQVRWAAYLPESGTYRVHAWWPSGSHHATNAPYRIVDLQGETVVRVNQREQGGQWNLQGTFSFSKDIPAMVFLSDDANGHIVADGIWFEPAESEVSLWEVY